MKQHKRKKNKKKKNKNFNVSVLQTFKAAVSQETKETKE